MTSFSSISGTLKGTKSNGLKSVIADYRDGGQKMLDVMSWYISDDCKSE